MASQIMPGGFGRSQMMPALGNSKNGKRAVHEVP